MFDATSVKWLVCKSVGIYHGKQVDYTNTESSPQGVQTPHSQEHKKIEEGY